MIFCAYDEQHLFYQRRFFFATLKLFRTPCTTGGFRNTSKNHPLTEDDINYNKDIGSTRIFIEHTNGWIKRFKILSTKFRNNLNFFAPFAVLICALYNFYIA